jgi:archaemetzincin
MSKTELPDGPQREAALAFHTIKDNSKKLIYYPDPDYFKPITKLKPGDWMYDHRENGQTYQNYLNSAFNPVKPQRNVIYLYIIDEQCTKGLMHDIIIEFLTAYYHPMKVSLYEEHDREHIHFTTRRNPFTGNKQILTRDIFEVLKKKLPCDAYCMIGITMTDLYPDPDWNFVFGQASLRERIGVFSFARYDDNFYGKSKLSTQQATEILLRRSCKVSAHEIGHMFGIHHCIYYNCMMNGSNSLPEADQRPFHLCPIDLRKLQTCIGFDEIERYQKLFEIYSKYENLFSDEKIWVEKRINKLCEEMSSSA